MTDHDTETSTEAFIAGGRRDTCERHADMAAELCSLWLESDAVHEALTARWQALENRLVRDHNWFGLSEAERKAMPEAEELQAIEDELAASFDRKEELLCTLSSITATSAQGIYLKLRVAAACVLPDENEEAHTLLKNTVEDFGKIMVRERNCS